MNEKIYLGLVYEIQTLRRSARAAEDAGDAADFRSLSLRADAVEDAVVNVLTDSYPNSFEEDNFRASCCFGGLKPACGFLTDEPLPFDS